MEGLPDGKAWYAYNVKRITTTDYTPEQIHQIGLDEVKRIHGEMAGVMKQVGFKGTLDEFFKFLNTDPQFFFDKREDLIAGYDVLRKRVNPQLPQLFEILPKADYEVRAVEPFREKSAAGGQYQAATEDGSRPGIFYANAYDLSARPKWAMEALSLHEANPGHHFQISIQREQQGLPKFRRFGGYTAYSEGWGLYAESLGQRARHVHGPVPVLRPARGRTVARHPPRRRHRACTRRAGRASRCSTTWTRTARPPKRAASPRPSATWRFRARRSAYKIGQLKISELRARAEKALGPKFDIRKFHTAVLMDGALPLDVLEAKVDRWIASQS